MKLLSDILNTIIETIDNDCDFSNSLTMLQQINISNQQQHRLMLR